jgi:hypothetical protein
MALQQANCSKMRAEVHRTRRQAGLPVPLIRWCKNLAARLTPKDFRPGSSRRRRGMEQRADCRHMGKGACACSLRNHDSCRPLLCSALPLYFTSPLPMRAALRCFPPPLRCVHRSGQPAPVDEADCSLALFNGVKL